MPMEVDTLMVVTSLVTFMYSVGHGSSSAAALEVELELPRHGSTTQQITNFSGLEDDLQKREATTDLSSCRRLWY